MMTKIWAHRGASRQAPENTLPAFARAIELGADGIELDVQLSADGVPVVFHDFELDHLSDGQGLLRDRTLAELRQLNFNRRFPEQGFVTLPTLAEVLALLQPTRLELNIEIKSGQVLYPGLEAKVLELVAAAGMRDRVWYSSFNHYALIQVRALDPQARCGILFDNILFQPWRYARQIGMQALHPHHRMLAIPGLVRASHAAGLAVHAWTADRPEDIRQALQLGVDAVITNVPDTAIALAAAERPADMR